MTEATYDSQTDPEARTRIEPSAAAAEEQAPLGEVLAVVLAKLGEGGMAVVYTAYDGELDRKVAIKVLRGDPEASRSSHGQARLLREAQTMARLNHPNIVQIYEVGKIGQDVFIAMELVQGQSLRAWTKVRKRHHREVVHVFLQAGERLAAAHAAGVIHRDFKPNSVLRPSLPPPRPRNAADSTNSGW